MSKCDYCRFTTCEEGCPEYDYVYQDYDKYLIKLAEERRKEREEDE